MINSIKGNLNSFVTAQRHIAPLAVLRVAFGAIMLISMVRFLLRGWVYAFYIKPVFHFTFYGFDWVKPPGAAGMYALFGLMVIAAILVTIGLFYRWAIAAFFYVSLTWS